MKTVKQIAGEIGVSKQAIFKKIDNLGLRQRLSKVNNQWLIDESVENTIKSVFSATNKTPTGLQTDSQLVDGLVAMLRNELEVKNKQIDELNNRLAESQRLLDQQQQLNAIAEQKIRLLEEKKEEQEEQQEEQNQESEAKETFWHRLWHKGN